MRKRVSNLLILVMCISLSVSGCGDAATETPSATETPVVTETPAATETPAVTEMPEATEAPTVTETPEATEAPDVTETPAPSEASEASEESEVIPEPFETELIYIGEGSYMPNIFKTPEDAVFYGISQVSKEPNDIIDEIDWLADNGFLDPRVQTQEGYYLESGQMYIFRGGEDPWKPTSVELYDQEFNTIGILDFEQYISPTRIEYENWPTIPASVKYVEVVEEPDGKKTMYVSISHNTYADYYPDNAYILCIDLDSQTLLWKSEALVSNADNFVIKDGTIFAGYGFTDEDDFVYMLNRYNGEILGKVKVKTGPDFLFERDNQLSVRCYDTNYVFDILE